jgi:choice-of-anchor C domain-containing protein
MRLASIGVAIALMTGIPAEANLLTNGSFETGPNPGSFTNFAAGSTAITGWTVSTPGNIDYIGSLWVAANGSRSLDLEGSAGTCVVPTNCPGGIEQSFATTAGAEYTVTFDLAGNPDFGPLIKTVMISAAGQSQNFSFDITGKSFGNMGWVLRSWTFTAAGPSTTLKFYTADSPATGFGPALDNVDVELTAAVPEPETFALLSLGLVSIGFLRRRRGRHGDSGGAAL